MLFKILSAYLLPFALPYMLFIYVKKIFTRRRDYGFPVISVGNITSGGTGKTPLLMEIVRILHKHGKKVTVASRGFKDENMLLARNFPGLEFTSKNRQGLAAIKGFPGIVVLDDGFHCRWVKKDLDILVIDASNPFDNNRPIPAGLLREPKYFMKQADIFVVTRTYMVSRTKLENLYSYIRQFNKPIYVMDYEVKKLQNKLRSISADVVLGSNVIAFTGIGNPMNFFALLARLKPSRIKGIIYPDHFHYSDKDVEEFCRFTMKERTDCIITTEKDFVKLEKKWPCELPLFYLALKPVLKELSGKKTVFDTLLHSMIK